MTTAQEDVVDAAGDIDEDVIDWVAVNEQAGLDQPDAIGSKVTSHTQMMLILEVYTDRPPEDALQDGLDAGVLDENYITKPEGGRGLRGYIYLGPRGGENK